MTESVEYRKIDQAEFDRLYQEGAVIEDADLSGIDWLQATYPGLHLRHCRLVEARLTETLLEEGYFDHCLFLRCGFARSLLSHAVFEKCSFFDGNDRKGCDFSFATLREATFKHCNLLSCSFRGATLYGLTMEDCKVQGGNFEGASFGHMIGGRSGHRMTEAHLHRTNFDLANFRKISLATCSLMDSSFREADLSGGNFLDADMSLADLSGAYVDRACFENTDLRGATLDGFDLSKVPSFQNMMVSEDQQSVLLKSIGIQVF